MGTAYGIGFHAGIAGSAVLLRMSGVKLCTGGEDETIDADQDAEQMA